MARILSHGQISSGQRFVLQDYSYFQFSWESERAWRMAYLPNPWITGVANAQQALQKWEAREALGELTHEEASELVVELPYKGAVPAIRFEYSLSQYREIAHPAAHFHMGRNANNRWPCALLLGPLAFCMMIARLYYPDQWRSRSSFEGAAVGGCLDLRFAKVIQSSQVVREFTGAERRTLHLGRNMEPIEKPPEPKVRCKRRQQRRRQ